ncbi:MAG: (2Fe-2S)-binding protein [Kiritimatiellia bacterium]|jgi:carbon-monoxide dehydrogenase small subunit|nr:(2Fe-2S)-binding protein [Pseudomonadales bacterium]MDP7024039.1 (2Fe-2S)-binding protein [Kiritimatiellia bacterium]|tara:strand:- start:2012 stop:2485 length:474 start_codon:yes stop_codon:yes gene_type:complete
MQQLTFEVNGRREVVAVDVGETLLDCLRERLHLTGAKDGCREGECGACTVLVDGQPVDACLYPALACEGVSVRTVEGIGTPSEPSDLQKAIVEHAGLQCGFCTPGIVVVLTALLEAVPNPGRANIQTALAGNLCRCTGYAQIEDAVLSLASGAKDGL